MLLSEIEIARRLVDPSDHNRLTVMPIINAKEQFGPSSLDVRLGTDFRRLENINRSQVALNEQFHDEEEAYTTRFTPASRHAISNRSVPFTLA